MDKTEAAIKILSRGGVVEDPWTVFSVPKPPPLQGEGVWEYQERIEKSLHSLAVLHLVPWIELKSEGVH